MAKGLNQVDVSMRFTADTESAKAAIQSLQNSLTNLVKISTTSHSSFGFTKEIQQATQAAAQLKVQLQSAINADTGKLDLGKFSDNLRKGKTSLADYQKSLAALGPEGKQAFSQLANSVLQAEIPLRRSNALLAELWTTMKNTARWQLSSSVLHGFMGAVQEAYGYAKDLNESLNNIRIVTGHSVEEMGRFAAQANKAAKALSSTTTEYTNAALIYYQQGLGDAEIEERTAITLKMANVARQSAEVVSDQMTAVWNNFDDGSKSLEYYADVMTALGAATASSTDEIAAGLEKFSAVAGTVGLSYEYATAALATVTAETRQSADVVGTAFKTLFARIEGLSLGETLEDGTDLNKYSEALAKVGVQIKDLSTGEMKSMDQILEDLGARWQTLAQDEKIALAQTVAGVRQYNQLISLMDNWDTFQENLGTAYNSTGALQEQADIYAESWEAARDRVTAAAESIYQSLIDDKFFIGLNNGLAEILENIEQLIKSLGGLPGVLSLVGSLIFKIFNQNLTSSLDNVIYNIKMSTTAGKESIKQLRQEAAQSLIKGTGTKGKMSVSESNASQAYRSQGEAQQLLLDNAERLTEEQKEQYQILLDGHNALVQQSVKHGQELEIEQRKTEVMKQRTDGYVSALAYQSKINDKSKEHAEQVDKITASYQRNKERLEETSRLFYEMSTLHNTEFISNADGTEQIEILSADELPKLEQMVSGIRNLDEAQLTLRLGSKEAATDMINLFNAMDKGEVDTETLAKAMNTLQGAGEMATNRIEKALIALGAPAEMAKKKAKELTDQFARYGDKAAIVTEDNIRLKNSLESLKNMISSTPPKIQSLSNALVSGAQVISNFSMLLSSIKGIVDTLNNQDMTFGEKFFTIFTQMGFILPTIISMVGQMTTLMSPTGFIGAMKASSAALEKYTGSLLTHSLVQDKESGKTMIRLALQGEEIALVNASTAATDKNSIAEIANTLVDKLNIAETEKENVVDAVQLLLTQQQTKATMKLTAAELAHKAAKALTNPYVLAAAAAMAILIAAIYALVKAYQNLQAQSPEAQLEKASAAAQQAANEYQQTLSAYESLKTSITDSQGVESSLAKMTRGSAEWKIQLIEANMQAQELINKFDLLKGEDYKIGEDGLISFTQEGYDKMFEYNFEQLVKAQGRMVSANIQEKQAEYDVELAKVVEDSVFMKADTSSTDPWGDFVDRWTGGEDVTLWEGAKALGKSIYGAWNDSASTGYESMYNAGLSQEQVESIVEGLVSGQNFEDIIGTMELSPEAEAIANQQKDALEKLAASQLELANAELMLTAQLIDAVNYDNETYNNSEDKDLLAEIAAADVTTTGANEDAATAGLEGKTESEKWDTVFKELYGEDYADKYKIEDIEGGKATIYTKNDDGGWKKISDEEGMDDLQGYIDQYIAHKGADRTDANFQTYQNDLDSARTQFEGFTDNQEIIDMLAVNLVKNQKMGVDDPTDLDITGLDITKLFTDGFDLTQLQGKVSDDTFNALMSMIQDYLSNDAENANKYYETDENGNFKTDDSGNFIEKDKKEYDAVNQQQMTDEVENVLFSGMSDDEIAQTSKEIEDLTDEIQRLAKEGEKVDDSLEKDAKAAKALATAAKQTERGIEKLSKGFKQWKEDIDSKDIVKSSKAMTEMKDALADVMNVSDELNELGMTLGDHFGDYLIENMDTVEKAAKGDQDAIIELQEVATQDILMQLGFDPDTDTQLFNDLSTTMDMIRSKLNDGSLKFGAVDDTALLDSLNGIINACATTVPQAEAILANMGFDAEVTSEPSSEEATTWIPAKYEPVTEQVGGDENPGATFTYMQQTEAGHWETTPNTKQVNALKIKTANYVGGGNIAGAVGGSGSGAGGGGGGGGGGSKPKKAEKVKKTKKSDVVERYKEINDALDDMADALDKASGKADRLYGAARVKAMKEQAKLMRQEVDLLKKKRAEAEKNQKADEKALKKAAEEAGVKLEIDEDTGNITNYTTEMEKLYKELNAAETKMDGMSTKEEQDEYKEKVIDDIQDRIDLLTDAIGQYEETRELIEDLDKEIMEGEWATEDLEFETFEYEIELKIEIDDTALDRLDYLLGKIEDKAFAAAERISLIFNPEKDENGKDIDDSQFEQVISKIETTTEGINKVLGDNLRPKDLELFNSGNLDEIDWQYYVDNEIFTPAEIEHLKEGANTLLECNETLLEMRDTAHEELKNAFAEWNEEIEKGISLFDHYDSIMDHMQNIADLTQGLTGYNTELNRTMAQSRRESAVNRANSYKAVYDDQKKALDELKAQMNEVDEEGNKFIDTLPADERRKWLEDLEAAEEAVREAEENLYASTADAISAAIEEFEIAFTTSLKDMENKLVKGGFTQLSTEMERQAEISERTLKAYQETYELSKLNRQVINSINDTDNIKAKQALLEIQKEITAYQEDGEKMSQYELDHLQKKYELRLAEIALEEAQNAKSTVRMSRDSEGNWGYIYTADQDKVAEAQQNYEDKLYEITNLATEYSDQLSQSIAQTYQEFSDAMQDIYDRWAEGQFASEADFLAALDETRAYYEKKLGYQYEQLDIATENSRELYETDWANYEFSTGKKVKSNEDFRASFDQTMLGMKIGYENSQKAMETFRDVVGYVDPNDPSKKSGIVGELATSYTNMATVVNTSLGNIGTSLAGLNSQFTTDLTGEQGIVKKTEEAMTNIVNTSNAAKEAFIGTDGKGGLLGALTELSKAWRDKVGGMVSVNDELVKSLDKLNNKLVNTSPSGDGGDDGDDDGGKGGGGSGGGKGTQGDGKVQIGDKVKVKKGTKWYYDSYGTAPTGTAKDGTIKYINEKGSHPYNIGGLGWVKKSDISGYDTGGYTGQWGPEGKLAFLHQKELILNAGDTENFLMAMNVLKEITKAVTLQTILPDLSKINLDNNQSLQQEVTIHADFPNVTDHNEVEAALNNLINTASQYANRK